MIHWTQLLPNVALLPDGETLLMAAALGCEELATVRASKADIVATLRTSQRTAAGFYTCFPFAMEEEIRSSNVIFLDVRATAVTAFSKAKRIHADTPIGNQPWSQFRALHPGSRADSRPRLRTLTLSAENIEPCAFDLDAMSAGDRSRLLASALQAKLLVGFDLAHAFSWLFTETAVRPTNIADLLLVTQHLCPEVLLRPFAHAALSTNDRSARATQLLQRSGGRPKLTLDYLAQALEFESPNLVYDNNPSWCVTELGGDHRAYVEKRVELLTRVTAQFFPPDPYALTPKPVSASMPAYEASAKATIRLAESHVRGVPFDAQESRALRERIGNGKSRGSDCGNAAAEDGSGRVSEITTLRDYEVFARFDGRLHSLLTFGTCTGRTTSRSPALQNLPTDPEWRALIQARPGRKILSVDYVGMELRVAAALA